MVTITVMRIPPYTPWVRTQMGSIPWGEDPIWTHYGPHYGPLMRTLMSTSLPLIVVILLMGVLDVHTGTTPLALHTVGDVL